MERRGRERHEVVLPVRVTAIDTAGRPLLALAHTVDVTPFGARVGGLHSQIGRSEIVVLKYQHRQCRFRVVWSRGGAEYEVGLECLELSKDIWLLPDTPALKGIDGCRETELRPLARRERRSCPRYPIDAGIELRTLSANYPQWGRVQDISRSGCYCATPSPQTLLTSLRMKMYLGEAWVAASGVVRVCYPAMGMGIEFSAMASPADRERLTTFLSTLPRPADALAFGRAAIISPAFQDPGVPVSSISAPRSKAELPAKPKSDSVIFSKHPKTITPLHDIEEFLIDNAARSALCGSLGRRRTL